MPHSFRAAIVALGLSAIAIAGCASPQQVVSSREDSLSAAGFTVHPANTPDRIAMLRRLPPNRFVQRPQGDTMSYVYADPLVCNCLYVGSQQAYGAYRAHQQQQELANEQMMAYQTYDDSAWDWNRWGGGFGPGFAWSGPGW